MSHVYLVDPSHPLCGSWIKKESEDTSDYLCTRYTISVEDGQFKVCAIDLSDDEEFVIYDVAYDGEWIRFVSFMPSTGRTGRSWMRSVGHDKIEFRFTFTETEYWVRDKLGSPTSSNVRIFVLPQVPPQADGSEH